MNPRYIAAFALLFLSSSCATTSTTRAVTKGWVGISESQLLASWGEPDRTAALSDGGRVDTWLTDWNAEDGMHTCRETFTVDSKGKVVRRSSFDCTSDPARDFDTGLTTARVAGVETASSLGCKVLEFPTKTASACSASEFTGSERATC